MFLRLSRWCLKTALFAPLVIAPLFVGASFAFPANSFFPFISAKAIFFRVVIEGGLFFLLLHLLFSSTRRVQIAAVLRRLKKPLPLAIMVFALVLLITGIAGRNPTSSIWSNFERGEGVFQIIHYCLFFLLVSVLFTTKEEIQRLIRLNLIVSFFVCLYAIPQFLSIQPAVHTIGGSVRVAGTLGNPSYLAGYLLINFVFIVYTYLQTTSRRAHLRLIALFIFEFFLFLNTGTRAAYLAFAIGLMIIYGINMFTAKNAKTRVRLLVVLIGLGVLGGAGVGAYYAVPQLHNGVIFGRLFSLDQAWQGIQPRIWTWEGALHGIAERPILGWGDENFAYSFDKYYDPRHYGGESFFDRTHNIFLEYLISGGIVLLLAYLAIWYCYYRNLRGRQKDFWYSVLIAVPVMYLVQGFFLFDVLPIYLIIFMFLALVTNLDAAPGNTELSDDGYEMGHAPLLGATGLFALFAFIIIATSIIPWKKNLLITRAYSMSPDNPQATFNAFQEAITYPSLVGQEEAIGGLMKFSIDLLDSAAKQKGAFPLEIVRGIVDTNNSWYDAYKNIMPGVRDAYINGGLNLRVGLNFGIPEYKARGEQIYKDVLTWAPTRIEFVQMLMEVARATGDKKEFAVYFNRMKELRPDLPWQDFAAASSSSLPL